MTDRNSTPSPYEEAPPAIRAIAGPDGDRLVEQYQSLDRPGRKLATNTLRGLLDMNDSEFLARCAEATYTAAISGPKNDHHKLIVEVLFEEADRRHQAAGHAAECGGDSLYSRGLQRAARRAERKLPEIMGCTCGADDWLERPRKAKQSPTLR